MPLLLSYPFCLITLNYYTILTNLWAGCGGDSTAHYIQEAAHRRRAATPPPCGKPHRRRAATHHTAALAAASLPRDRVAVLARADRVLLRPASSIPPQPSRQRLVRLNLRSVVWTEVEQ